MPVGLFGARRRESVDAAPVQVAAVVARNIAGSIITLNAHLKRVTARKLLPGRRQRNNAKATWEAFFASGVLIDFGHGTYWLNMSSLISTETFERIMAADPPGPVFAQ